MVSSMGVIIVVVCKYVLVYGCMYQKMLLSSVFCNYAFLMLMLVLTGLSSILTRLCSIG